MIEVHENIEGVHRVVARTEDKRAALRAALDALARGFAAQNEENTDARAETVRTLP